MQHIFLYGNVLLGAVILIPAVLLIEKIAGKRFWCRYICPQSVLISLAGLVLPRRYGVRFSPKSCTCAASERACIHACSLQLNPRKPGIAQSLQCTNCGDCIDACRDKGKALTLGWARKDGMAQKQAVYKTGETTASEQ